MSRAPAQHVVVQDEILGQRRVPCICPRQHDRDEACARTLSYSTARGVLVERVACERCPRTWTRISAR